MAVLGGSRTIGAYSIERDYSHYVSRASGITLGLVGHASKGEIGKPTVCTSTADFIRKFGAPPSTQTENDNYYGMYAAMYFLNRGNKLHYVRVGEDAVEATGEIKGEAPEGTGVAPVLAKFKAVSPGTYLNGAAVQVYPYNVAGQVPIKVVQYDARGVGQIIETNLVTPDATSHVISKNALDKSAYIRLEADTDAALIWDANKTTPSGEDGGTTSTPDWREAATQGDALFQVTLKNGTDDAASTDDWTDAINALGSELIDINLMALPGADETQYTTALKIVEDRSDCLLLVDVPKDAEDAVSAANWTNGSSEGSMKFNSSFAAAYWPWVRAFDPYQNKDIELPPSCFVAPVYARTTSEGNLWSVPAGVQRGRIEGANGLTIEPESGDVDFLYSNGNVVNCIVNDSTYGLMIWGQRTTQRIDSALDRINVRMLLNYLKKAITAAARYLLFEPNDSSTWNEFYDLIDPTLRSVQAQRGISQYKIVTGESIVTDDDINNYRMPCKIIINPTRVAETIPIYFTLTASGVDFNAVLDQNFINQ